MLRRIVEHAGTRDWALVAEQMPGRSAKQCREHWQNYLAAGLSRSEWTAAEDRSLLDLAVRGWPRYSPAQAPRAHAEPPRPRAEALWPELAAGRRENAWPAQQQRQEQVVSGAPHAQQSPWPHPPGGLRTHTAPRS